MGILDREWVRWILFLPGLLVAWVLLGLVMLVFPPDGGEVIKAGIAAGLTFPVVFALAPRGKVVAGWFVYVPMMLFAVAALIAVGAEAFGLIELPGRPSADMSLWERIQIKEGMKSLAWLSFGTISFFGCVAKQRTTVAAPR